LRQRQEIQELLHEKGRLRGTKNKSINLAKEDQIMIDECIQNELLKKIDQLPINQQREVLEFADNLLKSTSIKEPAPSFLDLFGTLPPEDAREMMEAIEEGCEQVDTDGW
jgi:hypothetical protein